LRVVIALLRVGVLDAFAYRAEAFLWLLTTTMPLIMIALFTSIAHEEPIGRYGEPQIVAYFLSTFIVRTVTSAWMAWQINAEVRDGTLSVRLLRPVHPLLAYTAEGLGAMPMRAAFAVPVAVVMLFAVGVNEIAHDPLIWIAWIVSMIGAWAISMCVSLVIGSLSFFMESSVKVMDAWLAALFVFSGFLIPLDLFPDGLRRVLDWLPFRYQIALPVELMLGLHGREDALRLLFQQCLFVVLGLVVLRTTWRRGVARFAAFGG
jgi:ABC-2 type transport system permease protein